MDIKVAVLGSINRDFTALASRLPRRGEIVEGFGLGIHVGGKGSNQAVQAALLGAQTYFIGCTGDDENGDIVRSSLAERGVLVDYLQRVEGAQTGNCTILVDQNGDNMLVYCPGANKMITKEHIDAASGAIKQADILITQNEINQDAVLYGLQMARDAGVKTVLNPAPALPLTEEIYSVTDYITPNETESEGYTGLMLADMPFDDWKRANAEWFLNKGVKGVCITLGSKGAYYCDDSREISLAAFPVTPVDTTAAGDSFNAGFAVGISEGLDLRDTLRLASACGALATERPGAHSAIHTRKEIQDFLAGQG
ncbi:ribokinase [Christensenellaceae bacterium OttesenSCG-928-K19]|nr:ribokinase [Christensenellaceae bacterium OttesenSCG-928-K19]